MITLHVVLLVLAFLLFLLAGLGVTYARFNLGWLGAAALTVALFVRS
jgi:hypothetical protein